MQRRQFIAGAAGLIAGSLAPRLAMADVPTAFTFDMAPPMDNREKFIAWGVAQRGEDPKYLGERFDRFGAMVRNEDLVNDRNKHAFLLTPREKFVLQQNLSRAYDHAFLDIGYGVTISGPHIVGRMTSNIDPKAGREGAGDRHRLWLPVSLPLAPDRPGPHRSRSSSRWPSAPARSTTSSSRTATRSSRPSRARPPTATYGWEEAAPFDKIIVTCGIDHVPPPLLQQLKPGGIMVIPVGPPGAQRVLKVVKNQASDGQMTVARSDIYGGRIVPFVPFTKLEGEQIVGTHNN